MEEYMSHERERGSEILKKAKEKGQSTLEVQKENLAKGLDTLAQGLHQSAGQEHMQKQVSALSDLAADKIAEVSNYIRSKNVNDALSDLESLARREPAIVMGGMFAVGLLMARFLKSTQRVDGGDSGQGYRGAGEHDQGAAESRSEM